MMKHIPIIILATFASVGAFLTLGEPGGAAPRAAEPDRPVLIELFTSQGCSSCPPADKLASQLAQEANLVVVSRPVTYWDRLGWKDTLAREDNTRLQRAYARRGLAGRNGVYTPQIVVNGLRGTVGSNEAQIRQFIAQSTGTPAAIAVREQEDGSLIAGLDGATDDDAELTLLALDSHAEVSIGRGENGGRTIAYTNVLRDETMIARWSGGKAAHRIPSALLSVSDADRYALVLRGPNGGPILAARMIPRG